MSNIYYNPEDFGLKIVAEIEAGEPWSYDGVVVWRHTNTERLYGGYDSTCSCYSPFEGVEGTSDLTPITDVADLDSLLGQTYFRPDARAVLDFKTKVRTALR